MLVDKYYVRHEIQLAKIQHIKCFECGRNEYNGHNRWYKQDIIVAHLKGPHSKQFRVYKFTCPYCGNSFIRKISGV